MTQIEYSICVLFVTISCFLVLRSFRFSIIEPASLFLIAWIPGALLLLSNGITYYAPFAAFSTLFITSSIVFFTMGAISHRIFLARQPAPQQFTFAHAASTRGISRFGLVVLVLFSFIFIVMASPKVLELTPNLFTGRVSLLELRLDHWDSFGEEVGRIGIVKAIGRTAIVLLAIYVIFFNASFGNIFKIFVWVGILVFLLDGILLGGRANIAFLVLSLFFAGLIFRISVSTVRYRSVDVSLVKSAIKYWQLALVFGMIVFVLVVFPFLRNPETLDRLDSYLTWGFPSEFSEWVSFAADSNLFSWLKEFYYGTAYLPRAQVSAVHFFETTNLHEYFALGAYNGRSILRMLAILDSDFINQWYFIREEIASLRAVDRLSGNPWATFVRDLSIDFGVSGTMIAMFFCGFLFQAGFFWGVRRASYLGLTVAAMLCLCGAAGAFFSPLINQMLTYPIFLAIFLVLFNGDTRRRFRKNPLRVATILPASQTKQIGKT